MNYLNSIFDYNSQEFISTFDELPLWSAPFGLTLLEFINYKKNLKVLDIGCGTGFTSLELAQRLGNESLIYCLDPWQAALDRFKQKSDFYNVKNIEIINGKAENIPFQNDFFDLVISNNGLNNVENLEKALSECHRTMKKGSQIIFTFNLPETFSQFYTVFEKILEKNKLFITIDKLCEHIFIKRKTIEYMQDILEKSGFEDNQIIVNSFSYKFVDGTSFLNYYFVKMAFIDSWKLLIPEEYIEKIFAEIEQELNKQANVNGSLNFHVPYACFDYKKI